jgi:hypothetical protein
MKDDIDPRGNVGMDEGNKWVTDKQSIEEMRRAEGGNPERRANRGWEAAKRIDVIVTHGVDYMAGTRQNDEEMPFQEIKGISRELKQTTSWRTR